MDNILLATILIIFFTALFTKMFQSFDRVLKSLKKYHVSILRNDNKKLWGVVEIFANGIKLNFSKPFKSSGGSWVDSYIFYQADIDSLTAIFRYHDELSPKNKIRRLKQVKKVTSPSRMVRLLRIFRNFISNFQEAFAETLGVFLNKFKSNAAELLKHNEKHLKQFGASAIGAAGKEYDQILEKHINNKVVVSLNDGTQRTEYTGYLAEYSNQWLALLNCELNQEWSLPLNDINKLTLNRSIDIEFTYSKDQNKYNLLVKVKNYSDSDLQVKRVKSGDFIKKIYKIVAPMSTLEIQVKNIPETLIPESISDILDIKFQNIAPERTEDLDSHFMFTDKEQLPPLEILYSCSRKVDIFAPRKMAVMRHSVIDV
jgi:small nuclear ribonucleoprotein (snRNP)-like protein